LKNKLFNYLIIIFQLQVKVFNNCLKDGVFVAFDDIKFRKLNNFEQRDSIKCLNLTSSIVQTNELNMNYSTYLAENETSTSILNNTSTWFEEQTSPEPENSTKIFTEVFDSTSSHSTRTTTKEATYSFSIDPSMNNSTTRKPMNENSNRLTIFIAVGSALLFILLLTLIFFCFKCKKLKAQHQFGSLQLKNIGDNL